MLRLKASVEQLDTSYKGNNFPHMKSRAQCHAPEPGQGPTWMLCTTSLNSSERWVQTLTSSMARSKFLTYSPYILRNGASFCRMSPSRGFMSLCGGGEIIWETTQVRSWVGWDFTRRLWGGDLTLSSMWWKQTGHTLSLSSPTPHQTHTHYMGQETVCYWEVDEKPCNTLQQCRHRTSAQKQEVSGMEPLKRLATVIE